MDKLINFIIYPEFTGQIGILRIVFICLFFVFAFGWIYFATKSSWFENIIWRDLIEIFSYKSFEIRGTSKGWTKILKRFKSGLESEYKLAIIESDAMLDNVLKRMGYGAGETLGERLEHIEEDDLPGIEEIQGIHKIRNDIVHDPDYKLNLETARGILAVYEKALKNLNAI